MLKQTYYDLLENLVFSDRLVLRLCRLFERIHAVADPWRNRI